MTSQPKSGVGRGASAITAVCTALLVVTTAFLAFPALRTTLGFVSTPTLSYSLGGQIDVPAAIYAKTAKTFVIFARSSCSACQHAKPMFAEFVSALSKHRDARVVMVTGGRLAEDETKFAADLGLDATAVLRMDLDVLRLRVVPTTVLVNARGEVLYSTEGQPTKPDLATVLTLAGPA